MKINKDLSNVIVMANQPTDKRQIWLQRSDNLYDGQITNLLVGETKSFTLTLKPNTNYTLSSNIPLDQTSALLFIATGTSAQGASTFNNGVWLGQDRTMPTDTNGKITIAYRRLSNDIPSLVSFNYKLEEGSSVLKDKIYVLNENNTYDEFKSQNEIYSLAEQKIGTWIDGKPLYRRVIVSTNLSANNTNSMFVSGASIISIKKIDGYFVCGGGGHIFAAGNGSDADSENTRSFLFYAPGSGTIQSYCGMYHTGNGKYDIYVIIEYTKTTD